MAEPKARLSRGAPRWALQALVMQHLTVARIAESLAVAWDTANNAVLLDVDQLLVRCSTDETCLISSATDRPTGSRIERTNERGRPGQRWIPHSVEPRMIPPSQRCAGPEQVASRPARRPDLATTVSRCPDVDRSNGRCLARSHRSGQHLLLLHLPARVNLRLGCFGHTVTENHCLAVLVEVDG